MDSMNKGGNGILMASLRDDEDLLAVPLNNSFCLYRNPSSTTYQ